MTWLVQEIWLWMVLAALAGAVLTGFFSTTEVKSERWVPTPVPEDLEVEEEPASAAVASGHVEDDEVFTSPFPEFQATSGPRPWEEEELWTRPARGAAPVAAGTAATSADDRSYETDEWTDAADNWRGWAAEATAVPVEDEEATRSADVRDEADVADVPAQADEVAAEVVASDPFPALPVAAAVEPAAHEVAPELESGDEGDRVDEVEAQIDVDAVSESVEAGEAVVDGSVEQPTVVDEVPPVEELSAAEKIRRELARLEAELAKREERKRELLEAERVEAERLGAPSLEAESLGAQQTKTDEPVEAVATEPEAPARKPRKRSTPKPEVVAEVAPEQAEAERLEAERLEAERAARASARAKRAAETRARKQAERAEQERAEAERAEAEAEKARQKAERAAAARERARAKRAEAARLKAEQQAAEQAEAERLEAERLEAQRLETEQLQIEQATSLQEALTAEEAPTNDSWVPPADDSDDWKHGPFGPGSAYAAFDGSAPRGHSIKANLSTKLYHSRQSRFYSRTQADVWFATEEHAEAAGFTRWDQRGSMAHSVGPQGAAHEGPAA